MLKELAELTEDLDQMDENSISAPGIPDYWAKQRGLALAGTITDVELRKFLAMTADLLEEAHALLRDRSFAADDAADAEPTEPIGGFTSFVNSLLMMRDCVLRWRFDIPDDERPIVTDGWNVYLLPMGSHIFSGCGGQQDDSCI